MSEYARRRKAIDRVLREKDNRAYVRRFFSEGEAELSPRAIMSALMEGLDAVVPPDAPYLPRNCVRNLVSAIVDEVKQDMCAPRSY